MYERRGRNQGIKFTPIGHGRYRKIPTRRNRVTSGRKPVGPPLGTRGCHGKSAAAGEEVEARMDALVDSRERLEDPLADWRRARES